MKTRQTMRKAKADLFLPDAFLASCIMGAFVRDTRGCDLGFKDRFNHFAASPMCGITWFFEGSCHMVEKPEHASDPAGGPQVAKIVVTGPYRGPSTSWSPGDLHVMSLAFYPEAFAALFDFKVEDSINRTVRADEVLSSNVMAMAERVGGFGSDEEKFQYLQEWLEPLWRSKRADNYAFGRWLSDWSRSLAVRAATSGVGKSIRQIERRIKSWTGQSQRDLGAYGRNEVAYSCLLAAQKQGDVDFADLALEAGFADQSHMGRDVRRETGFSPAQLAHLIETEESFWCFRLFGQRL